MTRYWIFDREDTPQGYPLQKLLRSVQKSFGPDEGRLLLRRSEGYGAQIRAWEELLENQDEISVSRCVLDRISEGTTEWFYNMEAKHTSGDASVLFGLHDSSALFVETTPELGRKITAPFADVRVFERS